MEYRKIAENQGSFAVRLPREWVIKSGLGKGGYVKVEEEQDGSIKVTVAK
jgi:phosphate uptake regulator